jgi:NAD(P)H-dependent flavin oxidoreductase YrpB (nitropropane dioxygenase family)
MSHPKIIQGGMGVAISGWRLARAVSCLGQMGVVSGTVLAVVLARRLQLGDPGGDVRRALEQFPYPAMAERILADYFIPGGKSAGASFRLPTLPALKPGPKLTELTVVGSFVEVFLAKEGHDGIVGINLLEKIQLPTLPSLFGAMLADVDYVLMGAGIPRTIPGMLDRLAVGEPAEMKIDVEQSLPGENFMSTFDPKEFCGGTPPMLKRPKFLAIISSATLAITLARKSNGRVDGFIVEGDTAGGHNAPPRGQMQLSESGEPVYGPRDVPELEKIRAIGLPFWLAGSYGKPGKLADALALGAAGIQVGTAFAFCEESGLDPDIRRQALELSKAGKAEIFTDPLASPTGFPFKVATLEGSLFDPAVFAARTRVCDIGYLRHLYRKEDGTIGYRCPSEPVANYIKKGGCPEETEGRKCVCNGLLSSAGLGQTRPATGIEPALVTAGNDFSQIAQFLQPGRDSYTAADVISRLLGTADEPGA